MNADEVAVVVKQVLAAEREQSEKQFDEVVLKTIATILTSFGIDEEDRMETKLDLQHLRRSRKAYELVQTTTFKAAVGVIVTSALAALWLGLQAIIHR